MTKKGKFIYKTKEPVEEPKLADSGELEGEEDSEELEQYWAEYIAWANSEAFGSSGK